MPLGINILLDSTTAAALTERLPDAQRPSHTPHSRLVSYGDEVDQTSLIAGLKTIIQTKNWPPLSVGLVGFGLYPGHPCVVWTMPVPIHRLFEWHRRLDAGLLAAAGRHSFEHDGWLPHIHIGFTEFPGDAVEGLASAWIGPIEATMGEIEIVRYRRHGPAEVIFSQRLRY